VESLLILTLPIYPSAASRHTPHQACACPFPGPLLCCLALNWQVQYAWIVLEHVLYLSGKSNRNPLNLQLCEQDRNSALEDKGPRFSVMKNRDLMRPTSLFMPVLQHKQPPDKVTIIMVTTLAGSNKILHHSSIKPKISPR
jgi:hypothetical protein